MKVLYLSFFSNEPYQIEISGKVDASSEPLLYIHVPYQKNFLNDFVLLACNEVIQIRGSQYDVA